MADHGMGIVFEYQGRYAAAVSAREDGLKALREVQDRSFYTVDVLSGYGHALAQLGQFDGARKYLDEAMQLSRERKSQTLIAQVLNFQGATALYGGDAAQARRLFEQALALSTAAKDRPLTLLSRANLAKADVAIGRPQAAIKPLKALITDADALGLKYLGVESSVTLAQAYLQTKALPLAIDELTRSLANSERLGLRLLAAKSHYFLARVLDASNRKTEARRHREEAARALNDIWQEAKSDDILKRADLAPIYADTKVSQDP
jgi:tetratricopeptide (TPR) repeat protein